MCNCSNNRRGWLNSSGPAHEITLENDDFENPNWTYYTIATTMEVNANFEGNASIIERTHTYTATDTPEQLPIELWLGKRNRL